MSNEGGGYGLDFVAFWVTITPVILVDGLYEVDPDVADIPEDTLFLSLYQTDSYDTANGFMDECAELLGHCEGSDLEWLDRINQCLFIGDLARISLYQVSPATLTLFVLSEIILIVGGSVKQGD
jgi:hypothetical protein